MNNHDHPSENLPADDLVQRALDAMQRETHGRSPSEQLVADTLTALRGAEAHIVPPPQRKPLALAGAWQRVFHMTFTQKIAAAVGVALVGITIYFFLSLFQGFASVSYAQVADQLRARTLACQMVSSVAGAAPAPAKLYSMEPGHVRLEQPGGIVTIADQASNSVLMISPATHTAQLIHVQDARPDAQTGDLVSQLKGLADMQGKPAEHKRIDGQAVEGFAVDRDGCHGMVYANARTGKLVEVDLQPGTPKNATVKFYNFQVNPDLDASMFDLTPPAGYTLRSTNLRVNGELSANLVPMLKAYAAKTGGAFPPDLQDVTSLAKVLFAGVKPTTNPAEVSPAILDLATHVGVVMGVLGNHHRHTQWDYLPGNARLGDASKMIFWWQPDGTHVYKAIYGDLRVETVAASQIPNLPPSTRP